MPGNFGQQALSNQVTAQYSRVTAAGFVCCPQALLTTCAAPALLCRFDIAEHRGKEESAMLANHPAIDMYPVHRVPASRPFIWLGEGWRDMHHHRGASYAYGALVTGLGMLILAYSRHPLYLAATTAAFLMVGPLIAAGLCELSRCRDHGESTSFAASLQGLRFNRGNLLAFAGVLCFFGSRLVSLCALFLYVKTGSVGPAIGDTVWGDVMTHLSSAQVAAYMLALRCCAWLFMLCQWSRCP